MKTLVEYIFENLILEYLRIIHVDDEIDVEIGNHGDEHKTRGKDDNFKINLINITDNKITSIIKKFKNKILDKISNNTLTCNDVTKTLQLIDYEITICIFLKTIEDDKYILSVKSLWPTEDDYRDYKSKYNKNKKDKDNRKLFISDIK